MKSLIEKDKKRRKLFKKYESKRRELKAIIYNKENSMELRNKAQIALSKLPKNSFFCLFNFILHKLPHILCNLE